MNWHETATSNVLDTIGGLWPQKELTAEQQRGYLGALARFDPSIAVEGIRLYHQEATNTYMPAPGALAERVMQLHDARGLSGRARATTDASEACEWCQGLWLVAGTYYRVRDVDSYQLPGLCREMPRGWQAIRAAEGVQLIDSPMVEARRVQLRCQHCQAPATTLGAGTIEEWDQRYGLEWIEFRMEADRKAYERVMLDDPPRHIPVPPEEISDLLAKLKSEMEMA